MPAKGYTKKVQTLLSNVRLDVFQAYIAALVASDKCACHMTLDDIREALKDDDKRAFVLEHYGLTEDELNYIVTHEI